MKRGGDVKVSVVPNLEVNTLESFVRKNVYENSSLLTDGAKGYRRLGKDYGHEAVDHHKGEYVRGYVLLHGIILNVDVRGYATHYPQLIHPHKLVPFLYSGVEYPPSGKKW